METVLKADSTLHAELSADIQKELNMELNRLKTGQKAKDTETLKVYDNTLQTWIESSKQNTTSGTQIPDGKGIYMYMYTYRRLYIYVNI
jgi:hypothetical protein